MEQNIIDAGTQGFNLPHDIVSLPTGGIFYKSKKKSVKVGYLTAVDENILSNINPERSIRETVVLPLLRNKIYEHDLRPEELLDGDTEALLIFLRNTSFGPEYRVNLRDPKTNATFETSIMLDELNIKKTNSSPDENGYLTTTLPRSGNEVKLKLLNVRDLMEIETVISSYPKGRTAPVQTTRLNKMIVSIDGNEDRMYISKFIESMPIMDSKHIKNFLFENEPRLDLTKEVIAPSGERVMADITFGVEFFRPFF